MKKRLILFIITIITLSCSEDDTIASEMLTEINIEIVNPDGSSLVNPNCLNSTHTYAVKITAAKNENTEVETTNIGFSVNGVIHNITFTEPGSKIIIVDNLNVGQNTVQLANTGITHILFLTAPATFEIVD